MSLVDAEHIRTAAGSSGVGTDGRSVRSFAPVTGRSRRSRWIADAEKTRAEERFGMDMQSPMMQALHAVMMWLHQMGICPMQMPM
ncbi:Uncharacterised protein [Nocardia africana]|uniref:Uncharacterized protein n=1 Tax=Nocardia africana TaxID=134964 RepID=A0A378WW68_9NOCA|nr:Uncharacterised protein [Nocardia africana]